MTQYRGGTAVTEQQARVIDDVLENPVTVVSAGAGSGKTYTTVAAVLQIVEHRLASLDQFILITFTNKAADELRARMERELRRRVTDSAGEERRFWRSQQERLSSAYIGTIHGFCSRMLKTFGYEERVARESSVTISRFRLTEALRDAAEELIGQPDQLLLSDTLRWQEHDLRALAEEILEYLRGQGINPDEVLRRTEMQDEDAGKAYRVEIAGLVRRANEIYTARKFEDQVLDANDLLSRAAALVSGPSGEQVQRRVAERYRYLFIDEFQDTDRIQKTIIDNLLPELAGLLVVGDRKQSIYGFRSADVRLLEEIAQENDVPILPLSISRRPTARLLAVQNELFQSMRVRYQELDEQLDPWEGTIDHSDEIAPLIFLGAARDMRHRVVADQIHALLSRHIFDPHSSALRLIEQGDIAILVRSNTQLDEYERELSSRLAPHGISVRKDTGGQFYRQPEIVATYRMLRLILNYPNDTTLSLALGTPYLHGVDAARREREMIQYRMEEGSPLTDWFEEYYSEHAERLAQMRQVVRTDTVPQILARLYELFGIRQHYLSLGDQQAAENLERLREIARRMLSDEQALTLRQFTNMLQLAYETGREESEAQMEISATNTRPPYIRVMTIHRAKGLEFPIVIIPGADRPLGISSADPTFFVDREHGLDIDLSSRGVDTRSSFFRQLQQRSQDDYVHEEMRILYVAITRAQHAAIIAGSNRRQVNLPGSTYYAWQDEVLGARRSLEQLGAVFRF